MIAFDGQYSETKDKNSNNDQFHFESPNERTKYARIFFENLQLTLNTVCVNCFIFKRK